MKGVTHERINLTFLFLIMPIIAWYHMFPPGELAGFALMYYIHTRYVTPDLDTNSKPRKRLGALGYIIDMLFKHRGSLHSFWLWTLIFVILWYFIGAWVLGGWIAIIIHLVCDWVS